VAQWGWLAGALLTAACGGRIPVHTASAPERQAPRLRNFAVLQPAGLARAAASSDPMVRNPATFRKIAFELLLAFQQRGYLADTGDADFLVAYYAAQRLPVDTTVFAYGYPFPGSYPWWQDEPAAIHPPRADSEGVVIVDAIAAKTRTLLWRGEAVVRLSSNQSVYLLALGKAVDAIVEEFPAGFAARSFAPLPRGRRMR